MACARTRYLAALAAAGVLGFTLGGHGLPQPVSHDGMAGAAAGLCLLLVAVAGAVAPRRPAGPFPVLLSAAAPRPVAPQYPSPDARARASPQVLARFRN